MAIRNLNRGWTALAVGILLMSGASLSARAGDDCDECSDDTRWQKFCTWCTTDHHSCRHRCHRCRKHCLGGCRCYRALGAGYGDAGYGGAGYGGAGYGGAGYGGAAYFDPRDTELYSAQGYNVPVAVPLAPVVKHQYNYGWGVPSTRLTRVGAHYNQWYPNVPYSQTGGGLPGGVYPMVYQPTDTTQQGFYYMHVPRWGRYAPY